MWNKTSINPAVPKNDFNCFLLLGLRKEVILVMFDESGNILFSETSTQERGSFEIRLNDLQVNYIIDSYN